MRSVADTARAVIRRSFFSLPLLLLLGACSGPAQTVELRFEAAWGSQQLSCSPQGDGPALTDLRLYLHDAALRDADGSWRSIRFETDERWQQANLGMVDLEDGSGACQNGTPELRAVLRASAPPGDFRGLRFVLGVPFTSNHGDPLTASPPLDDPAMHWHWRSGYKFLRAGIANGDDGFRVHLGSAGCTGTVQNVTGCRFPNRVPVELPGFDPGVDTVVFDFQRLVANIDLGDGIPGDCASGPAESVCVAPFEAIGLDHASGELIGAQSVFRRRTP